MRMVVADASVAAKWFLPEPDAAAALRLLDGRHRLAAPDLICAEMGNIVWKLHSRGVLDRNEASEMIEHFLSMPLEIHDGGLRLHSRSLLRPSVSLYYNPSERCS